MNTPTARAENEALLPVEQADRDRAADWHQAEGNWLVDYHAMRRGEMDSCGTVQAFARHRLASTPTALPGAEDVALLLHRRFKPENMTASDWASDAVLGAGNSWRTQVQGAADEIAALIPRASDEVPANPVAEVLAALEPFARCLDQIDEDEPEEEWAKFRLTVGDYRRAARVFAALKSADAASSQEQGASGEVAK